MMPMMKVGSMARHHLCVCLLLRVKICSAACSVTPKIFPSWDGREGGSMNVGGGEGTSPARAHKACKAQATMAPVVEWVYVASVCCGVRQGEGLRSWVCSCIEHDRRWGSECGWPPTEAPRTLENLHRAGKGVDAGAMWACVDKACHVRVCGRPAEGAALG